MATKSTSQIGPDGVLASLSSESLDRLADLIIAKLTAKNGGDLLPKQDAFQR